MFLNTLLNARQYHDVFNISSYFLRSHFNSIWLPKLISLPLISRNVHSLPWEVVRMMGKCSDSRISRPLKDPPIISLAISVDLKCIEYIKLSSNNPSSVTEKNHLHWWSSQIKNLHMTTLVFEFATTPLILLAMDSILTWKKTLIVSWNMISVHYT